MSAAADQSFSFCTECGAIYRTAYARCPRDGGLIQPLEGDPLVGSTVAGRYVMEECVGQGAMGRVYRARHVHLSRRFAIKVLFGDLAADPVMRERFAREAEVASRLDHPNVVSVIDFGETASGLLYLAMDFVEGQNLGDLIGTGAMPEARVVALFRQLCEGLQHAHDIGLVHRDFKPDNVVVLDKDGREVPRILDFGLAILSDVGGPEGGRLTTGGLVMGTPAYISPEQACGLDVDHRADLFSLGITVYEMLAGKLPYDGTAMELARLNVSAAPPAISVRNPAVSVSPALQRLVDRLVAKRPDERFASAAEVIATIDALGDGVPAVQRVRTAPTIYGAPDRDEHAPTVPNPTIADQIQTPRRRAPWIALGLVLTIAVGGAGYLALGEGDEAAAAAPPAARGDTPALAATPHPPVPALEAGPAEGTAPPSVEDQPRNEGGTAAAAAEPAELPATERSPEPAAEPATPPAVKRPAGKKASGKAPPKRSGAATAKTNKTATAAPPPSASAAPPPPREISAQDLSALYRRVGAAVDRLEKARGSDAAAPYRKRYFAIPFTDAIRTASLRPEIAKRLRDLERDVQRAD